MFIGWFFSVVIDIINILCTAIEAEDHPPISLDGHSPKAFHLAFERMQAKPGQAHVSNIRGSVKCCQNIAQFANMLRVYTTRIVLFKKPF